MNRPPKDRLPTDSTTAVTDWLSAHPELYAQVRAAHPGDVRDVVLLFLYPYDRFPNTLACLLRAALDSVDWAAVQTSCGDKKP